MMRILWFSVTPSQFVPFNNGHNGGGWIASLEQLVKKNTEIKLGVAFEYPFSEFKKYQDNVTYYPINTHVSKIRRLHRFFAPLKFEDQHIIPKCIDIIKDFKPDVIHIFGSENCFGLLALHTKIPIVIHMQGSLPACYNARFPINVTFIDILLSSRYTFFRKLSEYRNLKIFKRRALREAKILRHVNYFFGRTHWDKSITRVYNSSSVYFYCSEVLREPFYGKEKWHYPDQEQIIIVSTISMPLYKGFDVILKTAQILKKECHMNFCWKIIGIQQEKFIESHYHIYAKDVSVVMLGCLSAEDVKQELLHAHFYVHPSYIDNSPNSVCEAQMLGTPVICCNVGGVSSLVDNNVSGFLVPANDPIKIADIINCYARDKMRLEQMSNQEIIIASERHSKQGIVHDLLKGYQCIRQQNCK